MRRGAASWRPAISRARASSSTASGWRKGRSVSDSTSSPARQSKLAGSRQFEDAQVRAARGEDGVGLIGCGDVSCSHRWDPGFIADPVASRNAKEATIVVPALPDRLSHHDVHQATTAPFEQTGDGDCLVEVYSPRRPIAGGNPNQ